MSDNILIYVAAFFFLLLSLFSFFSFNTLVPKEGNQAKSFTLKKLNITHVDFMHFVLLSYSELSFKEGRRFSIMFHIHSSRGRGTFPSLKLL